MANMVEEFANQIWNTCCQAGSDPKYDKLLIHSLHYFKTFAETEKFLEFFENKLEEIFLKLIVPIMTPDNTLADTFAEDQESFSEILLSNRQFNSKTSNCIQFLQSLGKF